MNNKLKQKIRDIFNRRDVAKRYKRYKTCFKKYSFIDCRCVLYEQFEASITRLYHTIEKGLAYENYRPGFGKDNVDQLIISLAQYNQMGYDTSAFFYETALSCLYAYYLKNKEYGEDNKQLKERIDRLEGKANEYGGVVLVSIPTEVDKKTFDQVMKTRHSIRHFSSVAVDIERVKEAIILAQYTPSACNRQGWKTRIISDKEIIKIILANQNGNRGFGHEIDKILIITADLRAQQRNRELFQAFIDGGMYAESVLNALYSKGIGSVPLSASLNTIQEKNIRKAVGMDEAEVLILFIGIGNYPEKEFLTTKSERRPISIQII